MSANWRLKEKKTAQCISIHLLRKKAPSIPVCESRFLTSFFKSHRSACMVSEMFIKLLLSLLWQYRSKGWEDHNAVSHQLFISLPQLTFSLWQIPGLSTHGLVVFSESLDISICSQTSDVFFSPGSVYQWRKKTQRDGTSKIITSLRQSSLSEEQSMVSFCAFRKCNAADRENL